MLKKVLLFVIALTATILLFFVYTGNKAPAPAPEVVSNVRTGPGTAQSYGITPPEEFEAMYYELKRELELVTDPTIKSQGYLEAGSFLKRFSADVDVIANEFVPIYTNETYPEEERALALLKVVQQANGNNRYDLLDQFLTPEQQQLSVVEKNYLVNQQIFALAPFAMVYASIKHYEVRNGLEFYADELYEDMRVRAEIDIARFANERLLVSLIPDTMMHAAKLYALIDETSVPYGVPHNTVVEAFNRSQDLNTEYSRFNPTKDYISLELTDYLLRIGREAEAQTEVERFIADIPTNMIRTYIANGGLQNGRFPHIAANQDIVNQINSGLAATSN